MNDKDIDPSLIQKAEVSQADRDYQMKYLCDEVTFIMFDLERGGFINYHGDEVIIDDQWTFTYKRVPVEETIDEHGTRNIVSNFFVTASSFNKLIFDYEVYGAERKFRVKHVEGFYTGMFINVLDKFRMEKFGITPP